jgi:ABC-type antimicrobial peptide transport system permease subunit
MIVAVGALLGLPLSVAASGLLRSIVCQESISDTATLAGVGLIVIVVAPLSCWLPARRALRLYPAAALYVESRTSPHLRQGGACRRNG